MMNHSLSQKISYRSLIQFTLPTILMLVFMSMYTIVDGMFVSRFVNTDALSAVNIVYPLLSIVIAMGTMFGTGITAIVAKKIGEGKRQEAKENFTFITICSVLVTLVISIVSLIFLEDIIYLLGANDAIFDYCYSYLFPLIFFLPASVLQLLFQYTMVANGNPNLGFVISLLGGIANMILDYVFIVPLNMGIAGAAYATGIGYMIPTVLGLIYFSVNRGADICFVKPKIDWSVLGNSIVNGSSEMVSNLSVSITTYLFNIIMMHFLGQDGVAAITIVLYMDFLLAAVNMGYSMGVAPLISFNYGCGDSDKLKKIVKMSFHFSTIFAIFVTVSTILFSGPLVSIFAQKGTPVFEFAVNGLFIYAFGYLFKGYNIFASALFTAFSNGKVSAILSFARTLVFIIVCILGLTAIFGVNGVWFSVPAAELLTLFLTFFYLKTYKDTYQYA